MEVRINEKSFMKLIPVHNAIIYFRFQIMIISNVPLVKIQILSGIICKKKKTWQITNICMMNNYFLKGNMMKNHKNLGNSKK